MRGRAQGAQGAQRAIESIDRLVARRRADPSAAEVACMEDGAGSGVVVGGRTVVEFPAGRGMWQAEGVGRWERCRESWRAAEEFRAEVACGGVRRARAMAWAEEERTREGATWSGRLRRWAVARGWLPEGGRRARAWLDEMGGAGGR